MERTTNSSTKRTWKHLNMVRRAQIESLLRNGLSCKEISKILGYSVRTIQREKKRGLVPQQYANRSYKVYEDAVLSRLVYCHEYAQQDYETKQKNKGPRFRIGKDHKLAAFLEDCILRLKYSPAAALALACRQKEVYPGLFSLKTFYNYIHGNLFLNISTKNLWYLSSRPKKKKRGHRRSAWNNLRGKSIEYRPPEANDRSSIGHWEIDLVVSKQGKKSAILTLVERATRFSLYVKIADKTQASVAKGLVKARRQLVKMKKAHTILSITADNGSEFLNSDQLKKSFGCHEVYYAHPFSSWERGSNENGNRLLRRFLPKKTHFDKITSRELNRIQNWVNQYPRKILGYLSASELFLAV